MNLEKGRKIDLESGKRNNRSRPCLKRTSAKIQLGRTKFNGMENYDTEKGKSPS